MLKKTLLLLFTLTLSTCSFASYLFIPMDLTQKNHLKAYGIAFMSITKGVDVSWLLNYKGGSFMFYYNSTMEDECVVRGVTYQVIADVQASAILTEISSNDNNMDEVRLTKVPKILGQCTSIFSRIVLSSGNSI